MIHVILFAFTTRRSLHLLLHHVFRLAAVEQTFGLPRNLKVLPTESTSQTLLSDWSWSVKVRLHRRVRGPSVNYKACINVNSPKNPKTLISH